MIGTSKLPLGRRKPVLSFSGVEVVEQVIKACEAVIDVGCGEVDPVVVIPSEASASFGSPSAGALASLGVVLKPA